jgi:RNA polymerase sigma-70 factor (ECF subfamily)
MVRLADGERDAFEPVFALLWPVVRAFAARALPVPAEADDAAQSALLKVFARAAAFDTSREVLPWALGIAAYECRTLRKARMRRREELGEAPEQVDPVTPEDAVIDRDLQAAAAEVLGGLSALDAETLLAAARGERDPSATFRKRLERALARFRKEWRTRHGAD